MGQAGTFLPLTEALVKAAAIKSLLFSPATHARRYMLGGSDKNGDMQRWRKAY